MNRNGIYYLKVISLCFLAIFICIYSLLEASKIITGPVITIKNPKNGSTLTVPLVEITGTAKNISYINMNGNPIFTDKDGN